MEDDNSMAEALVAGAVRELGQVLDFWLTTAVDENYGGFYAAVTNALEVDQEAPKGLVLNARILWTFSQAWLYEPREDYALAANRAADYLEEHFHDEEEGGYYLSVDARGRPLRTTKQTYGQAFALYGLAGYAMATGGEEARRRVRRQYEVVERARDARYGGYFEAFTRDWRPEHLTRLGEGEPDAKKSMNTHLHVLEAYTAAWRALRCDDVRASLGAVADIVARKVVDARTSHCDLYFEDDWAVTSETVSFGHDIEASWLLVEAAEQIGEPGRLEEYRALALRMVEAVERDGLAADGAVLYERRGKAQLDDDRHWWPQAEALVGFVNAYQISGRRRYLQRASQVWQFIQEHIVDHENGEWFWKVDRDGVPDHGRNKIDTWKCPYHNSRACFEVIGRLGAGVRL